MRPGDICEITEACSVKEWHGKRVRIVGPHEHGLRTCALEALPMGAVKNSHYVGPYLQGETVVFPETSLRLLDPQPVLVTVLRPLRSDDKTFALKGVKVSRPLYVAGRENNLKLTRRMLEATEFANVLGGDTLAVASLAAELASITLGCPIEAVGIDRSWKDGERE